ncbi:MAG TPA: nuclear transport factor 2 family protein [Xanthobacteraceae bacterium]|nr:nuclear transport factor 2 family protein [Xanthobacteraceae bacterium]
MADTLMAEVSHDRAIKAAIVEWTKAIRSKDATKALRHFSEDVVAFDLAPPLKIAGKDPEGLQAWFDTWDGPIQFEVSDLHIDANDELGVARSLSRIGGTKTSGEDSSVWVRSTVCFRRNRGEWKVFHVHSSVPFYMDGSVRAAIDLTP